MQRQLSLRALQDMAVLFPGDLHELGMFLLKTYDARDREANARNSGVIVGPSRPTLHGLAAHYARVTNIELRRIEGAMVKAGFDLGAIVQFDPPDSVNETDRQLPERRDHGMRKKRPRIARLDQVSISRDGEDAIIEFRNPTIATTHLRVGPPVHQMTDEDILLLFNRTIAAQMRNRDELGDYVAIEIPIGHPQVEHQPETVNQWSPRGGVLRCCIEDGGGQDGSLPVIYVDDQEFTWEEFGSMLCTYAGWGMRIVFVPDDELDHAPKIAVQEPEC